MTEIAWWAGTSEEWMNLGGPLSTREDAIAEGRSQQCGDPFWICQARLAVWAPPAAASVIDEMCENSDDLFYEDEFPGFDGGEDAEKSAEDDLQTVLNEWFSRHAAIFPAPTAFDGSSAPELIDGGEA